MRLQTKSWVWSIGIHGLIILVVAMVQFSADSPTRIAVIDFSLADNMPSDSIEQIKPQQRKEPRQKEERLMPRPSKEIKEQTIPSPEAQKQQPAEFSLSGKEISTSRPEMTQDSSPASTTGFSQSAEAAGSAQGGTSGSEEQIKATYLKEHFAYIRDRITKNISYPYMARKMGWHGRVKIAFVVCEDGNVIDVRVIDGCGCNLLDQNTVDTVKKVAPFPCPPVRAEIRMAINYRLD